MKKCSKCKVTQPLDNFYKRKKAKDGRRGVCKKCKKESLDIDIQRKRSRLYYEKNKESVLKKKRVYNTKNKDKITTYNRTYYAENTESIKNRSKDWYKNNKEKALASTQARTRERYCTDPLFKLKILTRGRIRKAISHRGYKKDSFARDLLGCSWEFYKKYIEDQFEDWMSWDNYSYTTWHIDHIVPLCTAKDKEELHKLFHYTNTRPLSAIENLNRPNNGLDAYEEE